MITRLTDLAVKKLACPTKGQLTHWDELTPGFGVRCSSKRKSFVVMYGEKRHLKTLGRYPDLPLAEARRHAKLFLATQDQVGDPQREHDYEAVVEAYLRDCQRRLRDSTLEGYALYLTKVRFTGPISKVEQGHVLRSIEQYTKSSSSQNYAFTTFKVFFNWAVRRQYLERNPLSALKRPNEIRPRERVLSDDELGILLSYTHENRGRFNDIVTLLALTGQRKGEIAKLLWSEIDEDLLVLTADRTKNKREHVVPLGRRALALLHSIEGSGRYVFGTAAGDKPYNGWSRSQRRIIRDTNLDHFTLHDLRRTFSTIHARIGTPIHVTEKLLNHVSGTISGVAAVYNRHSYLEEMREAVAQHDDFIAKLIKS